MANLITGDDVAAYLDLDVETYGPNYEDVAAVASVWVATYCTIPVDTTAIKHACLMLAARLARRRNTPEGLGGIVEGSPFYVSRTDPDANMLLAPYLKWDGFA